MAQRQARNKYVVQEVRLPIIGAMSNRSADPNKDQRFVNVFPETRKVEAIESTRIFLNKRPGLTLIKNIGTTGLGRGLQWFRNIYYSVVGNKVYADTTPVITLTDSVSPVGMLVANSATIGDYLFICDGVAGWVINSSGTVTAITDPDFPTPHVPVPTTIDGYIMLAKGSDVYNCTLDTPTSWTTGEYLTAEIFPDPVVALARQNNQVVVFGESSVEFFYDAANVSGSPLSRNESTVLQVGCAFPYAVYQNENTFMFIGQSESGGRAVWQVTGFQPKKISDEYVDRILDAETNPKGVRGFGFRTMGHLFFLISLPTLNRTMVYDTEEKLWHEWSTNVAGAHMMFACGYGADNHAGYCSVLSLSNGNIYKMDPTKYTDDGTMILVDISTNKYDMDTYKRKFMCNIRPVGDRYASGNILSVRWTDDDYQTWSNTKSIALTDDWPNFARLGSFRRRAFNMKQALDQPLRLESIEVTYYEGDS